jgi:superfamily II DNA or RNA helicase
MEPMGYKSVSKTELEQDDREDLWGFQKDSVGKFWEFWAKPKSEAPEALLNFATGMGKTRTAAACIKTPVRENKKVLWVTHRTELALQSQAALGTAVGLHNVGVEKAALRAVTGVNADIDEAHYPPVVVTSPQTLKGSRLAAFAENFKPDLIVQDEAHRCNAHTWNQIRRQFPDAKVLNLTATPYRSDIRKRLDLGEEIGRKSHSWGVKNDYLSPFVRTPPLEVDLAGVGLTTLGDYKLEPLSRVMMRPEVLEVCVDKMIMHANEGEKPRERLVVFAASREHGLMVEAALKARGESARSLFNETPEAERKDMLQDFNDGEVRFMINYDILTEGTDIPRIDGIAMLRPTCNASLYMQCIGRGGRIAEDKTDCLLIDVFDLNKAPTLAKGMVVPSYYDVRKEILEQDKKVSAFGMFMSWFKHKEDIRAEVLGEHLESPAKAVTGKQLVDLVKPDKVKKKNGEEKEYTRAQLKQQDRDAKVLDKLIEGDWGKANVDVSLEKALSRLQYKYPEELTRDLNKLGWVFCPRGEIPERVINSIYGSKDQDEPAEQPKGELKIGDFTADKGVRYKAEDILADDAIGRVSRFFELHEVGNVDFLWQTPWQRDGTRDPDGYSFIAETEPRYIYEGKKIIHREMQEKVLTRDAREIEPNKAYEVNGHVYKSEGLRVSRVFARAQDGVVWSFNVDPDTEKLEPYKTTFPFKTTEERFKRVDPKEMRSLLPPYMSYQQSTWLNLVSSPGMRFSAEKNWAHDKQGMFNTMPKGEALARVNLGRDTLREELDAWMTRYRPRDIGKVQKQVAALYPDVSR